MAIWKPSPVFIYECVLAARRWQTYAGRTAFLAILFISLAVVWKVQLADKGALGRNALAAVGEQFFYAIAGTQLALALFAAPAYTAGSICVDRARGTLVHLLVTDLTAAEIVLGKLGARVLPMFGLVLAGVPVLVLATLLGGVEPEAVAAFVNAFQFSIGLLLVSITSVAAFFEERISGSLDVVLVTPLPASTIIWGKWLASFRMVVYVSLIPLLLCLGLIHIENARAWQRNDSIGHVLLIAVAMLAHGAVVNSVGLALAIHMKRFGVAMGVTAAMYVLIAAGPALLGFFIHSRSAEKFAVMSPWFGIGANTFNVVHGGDSDLYGWTILWAIAHAITAFVLLAIIQNNFDRCVGRISDRSYSKSRGYP